MLFAVLVLLLRAISAAPLVAMLESSNSLARRGDKNDYLVSDLPGYSKLAADVKPTMHAGYIEVTESQDEEYFFWKFSKNHTSEASNKLIFWFNGGPGCSSMDGALVETGPLTVNDKYEVEYRPGTWLENGDVVYVDQPGGTGYSETRVYTTELKDIATDMLTFVQKYLELFPEDKDKEIYLSGESYAGQYIPYFAAKILQDAPEVNLKGLLIINGYIYPDLQNTANIDFAIENKFVPDNLKEELKNDLLECENTIKENKDSWKDILSEMESSGEYSGNENSGSSENKVSSGICSRLLNKVLEASYDPSRPKDEQCVNVYDFKARTSYPECGTNLDLWPPEQKYLNKFLNEKSVEKQLNIAKYKQWHECDSGRVGGSLNNQYSYPAFFKLPYILSKVPVMIIAGENDIICNVNGLEKIVTELTWNNSTQPGFGKDALYEDFSVDGKTYGQIKYENNLYFAKVQDASHMVPYSQPHGARAALDVFMGNYEKQNGKYVSVSHGKY